MRPLAIRDNLTPDVADFYRAQTGDSEGAQTTDISAHFQHDLAYQERAIFAGGCFWCMVEPFVDQPGIQSVISGYTGGDVPNPTYEQVISDQTGHVEAVEIIFDTRRIRYQELVDLYFQLTDPTDALGNFKIAVVIIALSFSLPDRANVKLLKLLKLRWRLPGVMCGRL